MKTAAPGSSASKERRGSFTTISGRPINQLYTPEDVASLDYERDLANPGTFPYTRGIHPTGYRGKPWTMRQFAGFGTPEETNKRYKQLLKAGGTGLSVAFDLPTLMGRDPDHELSLGEVGKCGVNITSLADMETLFAGIHLDVDDDQLAGGDDLRNVPCRCGKAGRRLAPAVGDDPERHSQGIHRPEGV